MSQLSRATCTGKWRFRVNRDWRGRQTVVLQMEWRGFLTRYIGGQVDTQDVCEWRDARLEDFRVVGKIPEIEFITKSATP